jgi:hypothetical protein
VIWRSALAAHSLMRDVTEQSYVTGDPLQLLPGAGVENELSAQLDAVFVFQMTLAPARCFSALVSASNLYDYVAMVISHNRLISAKQGSPSCTALAATLSNRHDVLRCAKQVEITLVDPVFDPQRQSAARRREWPCDRRAAPRNTCKGRIAPARSPG